MAKETDPGRIPGPVVIDNCCQVILDYSLPNGKLAHNILHARVQPSFAATTGIANPIMNAMVAAWSAAGGLGSQCAASTTFQAVSLRDVRVANMPLVTSTVASVVGTDPGIALASQIALVITLRTANAGRAFRGRVYIPGWGVVAQGGGTMASAAAGTAAHAWIVAVQSALNAQSMVLAIGQPARQQYTSPVTGRTIPARVSGVADVTQIILRDNTFDTQRRRSQL